MARRRSLHDGCLHHASDRPEQGPAPNADGSTRHAGHGSTDHFQRGRRRPMGRTLWQPAASGDVRRDALWRLQHAQGPRAPAATWTQGAALAADSQRRHCRRLRRDRGRSRRARHGANVFRRRQTGSGPAQLPVGAAWPVAHSPRRGPVQVLSRPRADVSPKRHHEREPALVLRHDQGGAPRDRPDSRRGPASSPHIGARRDDRRDAGGPCRRHEESDPIVHVWRHCRSFTPKRGRVGAVSRLGAGVAPHGADDNVDFYVLRAAQEDLLDRDG